jgi:alkanesulfonate monooxygenase SsuD/methylene tetrahydromethanopterin reductase-like flavin-dependent oxidoreductase (luciferase family)
MYMSGSSPEAGAFAARNQIGIGFAFTTVPLARKAVQHYRACARAADWEPAAENVIYRALFHVADTDEQAFEDMDTLPPRVNFADQNRAVSEAVLQSGYYGTDIVGQRQRNARRELAERIELGQVIVGSPDTVLKQVRRIRDELGAGILDLVVGVQLGEKTMRSIELFGSKVLPRMREL